MHPALCQPRTGLRNWGPNFPNCSAPVPSRIIVIKTRPTSPATATVIRENPAALRSSAAGSFQAVTPLPPRAPEEESRPSTPRYGFAVFIPACYSSTPLPGRIPPEVFRAGRRQPFRLLAQTVSVIADLLSGIRLRPESALPATDCAGRTVPGLTAKSLLPSFQQ